MTSPQQRVAIVTGGSGGIGRVTAERLARDGMSVAVHYAGNKARADEVVEAIAGRAAGPSPSAVTWPTRTRWRRRSTRSSSSSAESTSSSTRPA
jgi:NAD(P)-dependent dehydrogenase (short-subunit alcohol dehydrogenase family)